MSCAPPHGRLSSEVEKPNHTKHIRPMELPYIDLAGIDDCGTRTLVARELATISRTSGWAVLTNHGISPLEIDRIATTTRILCDLLREDQKQWPLGENLIEYEPPHLHGVDTVYFPGSPGVLVECQESLPPLWRQHLLQIETCTQSFYQLAEKLSACLPLAMHKKHARNPGSTAQWRLRRYTPDSGAAYRTVHPMCMPSSPTGSILLNAMTEGSCIEVELADREWRAIPSDKGIFVYLGDAWPVWSRGHHQKMRYRRLWSSKDTPIERLTITYLSTTTTNYDYTLRGERSVVPTQSTSDGASEFSSSDSR
ncbi:hypothetical protein LTR27_001510 [Elasticomyces elasticus]|nr:hypothetical protein LTR27_001510 [Elasticomyces elasticus]